MDMMNTGDQLSCAAFLAANNFIAEDHTPVIRAKRAMVPSVSLPQIPDVGLITSLLKDCVPTVVQYAGHKYTQKEFTTSKKNGTIHVKFRCSYSRRMGQPCGALLSLRQQEGQQTIDISGTNEHTCDMRMADVGHQAMGMEGGDSGVELRTTDDRFQKIARSSFQDDDDTGVFPPL